MKGSLMFVLFSLFLVVGCPPSSWVADYGIEITEPALIDGKPAEGWKTTTFEGGSEFSAGRLETEEVQIDAVFFSHGIDLVVGNRTDQPIRLIWAATRITGDFTADLLRSRIGTREELAPPQSPTTIPPGMAARYNVIVGPPGEWQPYTGSENEGFWKQRRALFDLDVHDGSGGDSRVAVAERAVGKEFQLHLELEVAGMPRQITLPARVAEATVRPVYY